MSPKQITYIAVVSLVLIFATQAYLVFEYFQTTRAALIRESDAILDDVFQRDLSYRHKIYDHITHQDTITVLPAPTKQNTTHFNAKTVNDNSGNVLKMVDLAINTYISKIVPMDMQKMDSITGDILQKRDIHSAYALKIVNPQTGDVLVQSKNGLKSSIFLIPSKNLRFDLENKKALQLILINPFSVIIRRMGLMLLSSLALAIICLLAFRLLIRILARQKQLVAFKNEFLGTIAHELKRPVASLTFNLDCLAMPIADPQQHDLLVSKSINATSELNDTITMIVALAKEEEGLLTLSRERVNLRNMMEELSERFESSPVKKVDIQTVYETDQLTMLGDRRLLTQCFANLIDNAIKYSNAEVRITITVRKAGHYTAVAIKDNGFGIPAGKLPGIFDKYSRAHAENKKINGYGIGLNYVKTIVEKHGGKVEVTSTEGTGSEFSVLLPE